MAATEELPVLSLWEEICAEFEAQQPPYPDSYEQKEEPVVPVPIIQAPLDAGPLLTLGGDHSEPVPSESAPAEESVPQETPSLPTLSQPPGSPSLKTCSPREFLEQYIFPVLLPGMAELLHRAKKEKCFELGSPTLWDRKRKRTKFIALDFLTEWLYNHNLKREEEPFVEFFQIPFVKDWLKDHPRPPIPLSLLLTEEEAGNIIQSFWRGYRIRCDPEVQELRQWQKHLRETKNIIKRVREFWAKQEKKVGTKMEDSGQATSVCLRVSIAEPSSTPQNVEVVVKEDQLQ